MGEGRARHGAVEIAYATFGEPEHAEPLLLVMGLGMPTLCWPEGFCAALADCGFAVAQFESTELVTAGAFALSATRSSPR